jgi:hypothetical protein
VPAPTAFCEQVQNVTLVHAVSVSGLILGQCSFSVTAEWNRAPHSELLFSDISRNICILWIAASVYLNGENCATLEGDSCFRWPQCSLSGSRCIWIRGGHGIISVVALLFPESSASPHVAFVKPLNTYDACTFCCQNNKF